MNRATRAEPAPPQLLSDDMDALKRRLLKSDGRCGECREPVGPWAGVIVVNHLTPLGLAQSGYLLCIPCADIVREHGEAALQRINRESREWARLLGVRAEGTMQ